jgi:hypothetical protein
MVSTDVHSTSHNITQWCLQLYIVLHITSHKSFPYWHLVHTPSSALCHVDDIRDFSHCTLLNITDNNLHIDLQHILLCPRLLLYTAGSALPYKQLVYRTVSNSKQHLIMLHSTYIHIIQDVILHYRRQWYNINHLLSVDHTGYSSNSPMDFITRSSPVWHTQWVHKCKYYYWNLHDFLPVIHSKFHYIFPSFYLVRIPSLSLCKSHDFILLI